MFGQLQRHVARSVCLAMLVSLLPSASNADIFEWEYVDPNDENRGRQQSITLVPDGDGRTPIPNAQFPSLDLTKAYLSGTDLSFANLRSANLFTADLSHAILRGTDLRSAWLLDVDFTDADIREVNLDFATDRGFTAAQLYSTLSYKNRNLSGIRSIRSDFSAYDFSGQDLTGAFLESTLQDVDFSGATLTGAKIGGHWGGGLKGVDFTDADIRMSSFGWQNNPQVSAEQIYSTASYKSDDLSGVSFFLHDLTGWNFSEQNLTNANLGSALLSNVNLTDAIVTGADLHGTVERGLTSEQFYSTASYKTGDLKRINFRSNDLSDWDLSDSELIGVNFTSTNLTGVDFSGTVINQAIFTSISPGELSLEQIYSTASYKAHDLSELTLHAYLEGLNLTGQDLRNSNLAIPWNSSDLTGARILGAHLEIGIGVSSLTPVNFYSTSSYQSGDLTGVTIEGVQVQLTGWDFSNQNLSNSSFRGHFEAGFLLLTDVSFRGANLTNAIFASVSLNNVDFSGADTRGAGIPNFSTPFSSPRTVNTVFPNGSIQGLDLTNGNSLTIRNYCGQGDPIAITVRESFESDSSGTLRILFNEKPWNSQISFGEKIPVNIEGILELRFADGVDMESQVGLTFQLFDWSNVTPSGVFSIESPYAWDLSELYSLGEVKLLQPIPEPATAMLVAFQLLLVTCQKRNFLH